MLLTHIKSFSPNKNQVAIIVIPRLYVKKLEHIENNILDSQSTWRVRDFNEMARSRAILLWNMLYNSLPLSTVSHYVVSVTHSQPHSNNIEWKTPEETINVLNCALFWTASHTALFRFTQHKTDDPFVRHHHTAHATLPLAAQESSSSSDWLSRLSQCLCSSNPYFTS